MRNGRSDLLLVYGKAAGLWSVQNVLYQRSKNGLACRANRKHNDIAQHVIVITNHVIAVAYSRDHSCQPPKKKYGDPTGKSLHGRYRDLFAVVDVSLKRRPKLSWF